MPRRGVQYHSTDANMSGVTMTIGEKNYTISDIMRPVITVSDTGSLEDVLTHMISEKRNSLVAVDADGKFRGAVNAIDIIKAVLPDYLEEDPVAARFADQKLLQEDAARVKDMGVVDFMNQEVATIKTDGSVLEAAVRAVHHGQAAQAHFL